MQKLNNEELEVYQFLAGFFYNTFFNGVSKELWQELKSKDSITWFLQSSNKENEKGVKYLEKSLSEDDLDDILVDFTSLFICSELDLKSPPYASFYLDSKGEIYSDETVKVKQFYTNVGYNVKSQNEPEDHLAFEIGFLYCLLENIKTNEDKEKYYNLLATFLSTHLLPWVFHCLHLTQEKANTNFYKAMAYLLEDFLLILSQKLDIKAERRELYNI